MRRAHGQRWVHDRGRVLDHLVEGHLILEQFLDGGAHPREEEAGGADVENGAQPVVAFILPVGLWSRLSAYRSTHCSNGLFHSVDGGLSIYVRTTSG